MSASRFVLWLLLVAPTTAHAGRHCITGQVLDRNGEPVPRAQITLAPDDASKGSFQLVTDREGRFVVDYLRDAGGTRVKLARHTAYTLEVWKPGFHTQTHRVAYTRGDHVVEPVTLVEETIQVADDAVDLTGSLERTDAQSGGGSYEGQ